MSIKNLAGISCSCQIQSPELFFPHIVSQIDTQAIHKLNCFDVLWWYLCLHSTYCSYGNRYVHHYKKHLLICLRHFFLLIFSLFSKTTESHIAITSAWRESSILNYILILPFAHTHRWHIQCSECGVTLTK